MGGIGEGEAKLRNFKVKLMWVVGGGGGWYERIVVTV